MTQPINTTASEMVDKTDAFYKQLEQMLNACASYEERLAFIMALVLAARGFK